MIIKNIKGISPVVAMSLLIVVAVISAVTFQSWYTSYQNNMFVDIKGETDDNIVNSGIQDIIGTELYFYNAEVNNITVSELKIDGNDCPITDELEPGMNVIDLSTCSYDGGGSEVLIKTNDVFYKKVIYTAPSTY